MLELIKETVKKKYTEAVQTGSGCGCTPDCCTPDLNVIFMDDDYKKLEGYQEIADYGLGCGLPTELADIRQGDTVLDLGSGAGNDVFIARRQVGETGKVIGVDFTEAMLEKANENKAKLGFQNVEFILGDIEDLPIASGSVDVVISNCVMNLVPDKEQAYLEVFRVLKPGGHFCISDVVLNAELPKGLKEAAEMYAGCVAGALEKKVNMDIIEQAGFRDVKIMKEHAIHVPDEHLLKYISSEELNAFKMHQSPIQSITINGKRP